MAAPFVIVPQSVDRDDKVAQVSVPSGGAATKLVFQDTQTTNFRTRTGRKAQLTFVGNSVDPGGEALVTFTILVNGVPLAPLYSSFQQALGLTYDSQSSLFVPLDFPQNAMIEVSATNSSSDTAYNAYIRVRVEYADHL